MQIKKVLLVLVAIITMTISIKPAFANNDGAYLIGRSTSYVNPLTGNTEDGGTNITLGESMVSSIVEGNLLLEQTGGKYYITVGLGLASNVSNVRFKIMNSGGSFSSVSATKTGSSSANGDTVNHYRIQMNSLYDYISPIMYVAPMGRDVQFFIKLDQGSITPGTGVYTSTMVLATANNGNTENNNSTINNSNSNNASTNSNQTSDTTTNEEQPVAETPVTTVGEVSCESLFDGISGLSSYVIDTNGKVNEKKKLTVKNLLKQSEQKKDSSNNMMLIIGIVAVIVIVAGGAYYYVKKVKK
ncbi:heme-binding Shp domain-containing protein [Thomasclavelia cocleata]|uniref:heme-binding Shp domain-containing protein n=1 Tax=Thomasclavelia cocleata TaxID=69824 RepID=UPI002557F71B|nr:heme-binding Shp domain-containing protein [Thomasclavelia cocleata]